MRNKQDGAMPRTPEDLDRKYEFEKRFWELKALRETVGGYAERFLTKLLVAAKVTGLGAPEAESDAANKGYVDAGLAEKAPAGYGLGGNSIAVDDLNKATNNGWYFWTDGAANAPFSWGTLLVLRRSTRVTQIAFDPYMSGHGGIVIRHYNGSEWFNWGWLNPPMKLNVEYQTIFRFNGSVVYAKLIDVGALPNSSSKSVGTGISAEKIVYNTHSIHTNTGYMLESPYFIADGTMKIKHYFLNQNLHINTTQDYSHATAKFQIWYVKAS